MSRTGVGDKSHGKRGRRVSNLHTIFKDEAPPFSFFFFFSLSQYLFYGYNVWFFVGDNHPPIRRLRKQLRFTLLRPKPVLPCNVMRFLLSNCFADPDNGDRW
ncbi:hypothetical protein GE21DRAFT_1283971 [Neurospora crassa]|nr:hypothetical protein GE21DRAFT_1283971 [Neurospora crassa]